MNWAQFKDPVSHMCLADTLVASWSLTQEVTGSSLLLLSLNSLNSVKHLGELQYEAPHISVTPHLSLSGIEILSLFLLLLCNNQYV